MLQTDLDAGAELLVGGDVDVAGRYMAPTVVTGVRPDGALMQEELFGPILPVLTVDTFQDALDFIAERPHPLAAYLFTDRPSYHRAFDDQVQAGGPATTSACCTPASRRCRSAGSARPGWARTTASTGSRRSPTCARPSRSRTKWTRSRPRTRRTGG